MRVDLEYIGGSLDTYFCFSKRNTNDIELSYYLNKLNIEDYVIYKCSNKFKEVSIKEFLEFRYSKYMLFHKNYVDKKHNNDWLCVINDVLKLNRFTFWNKPFPNFNPYERIKIIKYEDL